MAINIPNILSVVRILCTPLFVILLLKGMFSYALVVFTLAGITDALDGLIARYFNQKTALGAFLDPTADKLLLISAYIILAVLGFIPGWLTVIVLTRDVVILIGFFLFTSKNIPLEIKPSLVSKCTTVAQIATVIVTLLGVQAPLMIKLFFWFTAGLTTLSGLHYIYVGLNILQEGLGRQGGAG